MDSPLKQRLIGAAVLMALAVVFLPMLLQGPDVKDPDAAEVPLNLPAAPDDKFETRERSLAAPENTPPGGVLGMDTAAPPAPAPTPVGPEPPVEGSPLAPAPAPEHPETPAAAPVTAAPMPTPATPAAAAVPVATPPPPKTAAPSVAGGNYALNVGTFANLDNAQTLVARLRAAKLPVTTESARVKGAPALRVRVGPYADRAAAEAARLRTDALAGGSSRVITLDGSALAPAPAVAATPSTPKPAMPSALPPRPAPAPTTPKPAPAPTPVASASGFAVQLAAPAEEAAALGLRDRARAAGFVAFVQRVDTAEGARFRVRLGPAADRSAAEALRESASQKLGIAGNIVSHP